MPEKIRRCFESVSVTTLIAFVVALGLLIAVHEYGHYRVAVACGVKVLRFSVGFGKPLLSWQFKNSPTEFVLGMLPLGGYVRMLDEREAPVDPAERHLAFNTQPLRARAAIVAAGPLANLLLAVVLCALVNWAGVEEPKPVLSSPVAGSLAERAGLIGGEWVSEVAIGEGEPSAVRSFEDLRWRLAQAALAGNDMRLWTARDEGAAGREVTLPLSELDVREADAKLFQRIGIIAPWTGAVLGEIVAGGAAEAAGLQEDDTVLAVNGRQVVDASSLRSQIRNSVDASGSGIPQTWTISRSGHRMEMLLTARAERVDGEWVGRIGAFVGAPPGMITVQYGAVEALRLGVVGTWEVSSLTLRMMGRMLVGDASLKNLSGPLSIADYAGKSASLGWTSYLVFLALISVSLGVLNLLPLPVLDGGHLMYYLWEGVTGRSVSDVWLERLQRGGVAVLMALMSVALFNDITRLLG